MRLASLSLALLAALGCGRAEAPPQAPTTAPPPASAPGPVSSRGEALGAPAGAPAMSPEAASPIAFDLPAGWESQTPSSGMRIAQATVPGPGGPAELAVFHFGAGGGGGVDANIERWIGQMEPEAGGAAPPPQRDRFERGAYTVSTVEVAGTLLPSGMGSGPVSPQPNSLLLGAVVEGPGGPWFFKLTGPEATLAPQREAFAAMLRSVRAGS